MKRIIIVAALATLAACSQAETDADTDETAAATAEATTAAPAEVMAADGKPPAGKYRIIAGDGQVFTEELKADGTYVQTDKDGKVVETGKWVQKTPEQYCYTPDKDGAKEECNSEKVDDKGVWTSTNPEGKTAKVERIEA